MFSSFSPEPQQAEPDQYVWGNLYRGDCLETLPETLGNGVTVITDPPYSERTHAGHDYAARESRGISRRREIPYHALAPADVATIADVFCRLADGWIVRMCDHVLAPIIAAALEERGRYVFAPIPYVAIGSRVRLAGDGPSAWTCWIVVARTAALAKWGTLPGAYVLPDGCRNRDYPGGKPPWLMDQLVDHYSRPGGTVVDPFMGHGTTGVACQKLGRRFVGVEIDPAAYDSARARLENTGAQAGLF